MSNPHESHANGREASRPDCHWVSEDLHAFTEGESSPLVEKLIREHLADCAGCRAREEELKLERLWIIEAAIAAPALPSHFVEKILRRIKRAETARHSHRRAILLRVSAVAAAVLVIATLLVSRFEPGLDSKPGAPETDVGTSRVALAPNPPAHNLRIAPAPASPVADELLRVVAQRTIPPESAQVPQLNESVFPSSPPSFGHVAGMARRLDPRARRHEASLGDDPCKPDPNKDGKTDIIDVAYSCQLLLTGQPPNPLEVPNVKAQESADCDESCFRA